MTSTDSPCGYTSLPSPEPTPPPTSPSATIPFPYTFTDPQGDVVACASVTIVNIAGFSISECDGASTTIHAVPPSPTASILIIWDVPPATGQPLYDFYNVPAGFSDSLDNNCGNIVGIQTPFWEPNDPKQGRIDNIRPKSINRIAPGNLGTMPNFKSNCVYEEDTLGSGKITCDNDIAITCSPPSTDLADKIEPNNGACLGVQNVRTLVMVRAVNSFFIEYHVLTLPQVCPYY
jgi:hypothetical protein